MNVQEIFCINEKFYVFHLQFQIVLFSSAELQSLLSFDFRGRKIVIFEKKSFIDLMVFEMFVPRLNYRLKYQDCH